MCGTWLSLERRTVSAAGRYRIGPSLRLILLLLLGIRVAKLSGVAASLQSDEGEGSRPLEPLREVRLPGRPVWIR
jgi:hypothetical protein